MGGLPPTPGPEQADCVVVGAGIIGCAVALELSRQGREVLVVDAGPGAGTGSTSASSAIIRFHYSTWESVAIAWESYQDWIDWAGYLGIQDGAGMAGFVRTGALVLEPEGRSDEATLSLFDDIGVPYERLTAAQIRSRFPAIDPTSYGPPAPVMSEEFWRAGSGEMGGYLTPDSGYVDDPQLAAHNIMVAAQAAGATFRFRSAVAEVLRDGDAVRGVVLDSGQRLLAPVVVNVAGPASDLLNVRAGVTGDMLVRSRPLRTETHVAAAPADFRLESGGVFVTDPDLGSAFRPQAGGLVHISGIEPECDPLDWVDDPNDFNPAPTLDSYQTQTYRVARRMPDLTLSGRPQGLAALYDVTPDWTAIYDRSSLAGYYMACGTSGNAFKNAPMAGRFVAALVAACESGHDHDREPVRVDLPRLARPVSLASFSRRRRVGTGAAKNVLG